MRVILLLINAVIILGLQTKASGVDKSLIVISNLSKEPVSVVVYEPYTDFANQYTPTYKDILSASQKEYEINLYRATFIRISINAFNLELIAEPSDKINITVDGLDLAISIGGTKQELNSYYNFKYRANGGTKFYDVIDLIQNDWELDRTIHSLELEFKKSGAWVDSLLYIGKISESSYVLTKYEIESTLAGEMIKAYQDRYPRKSSDTNDKFLSWLTNRVDPFSPFFSSSLRTGYILSYLQAISERNDKFIRHSDATTYSPEDTYIVLAPENLKEYLWGISLYWSSHFAPLEYDHCDYFRRYKLNYPTSPFNSVLNEKIKCGNSNKVSGTAIFLSTREMSFFDAIRTFIGKRLLIDIWASWCAPCKMEFSNYDSLYFETLSKHKINQLYISIDDQNRSEAWKKDIEKFHLVGYHLLADNTLIESIKDIIFNGNEVIIPRYILLDENGRIISDDFHRPSNPKFKVELERLFKQ
ncbi:MAG: redoxin domain-containing protein [Cyclobacteriaceae bacterium]|nr:redoxin domain-containing protein [Cyclobacteriaceae bacterium]